MTQPSPPRLVVPSDSVSGVKGWKHQIPFKKNCKIFLMVSSTDAKTTSVVSSIIEMESVRKDLNHLFQIDPEEYLPLTISHYYPYSRERETERDRERQRETERGRERERGERQRGRGRETARVRDRVRQRERQRERLRAQES
jgi:hypothetical protein